MAHCTNLAAAANTILYDRKAKRIRDGVEPRLPNSQYLNENRGFEEPTGIWGVDGGLG
jgi:hypothetical protein